ncbi:MAG TPA: type III pantothenate kinase [Saprospiraceae bacterium]|nr:type III pantothenate kinase [Saprospiraceae bacterium]
MLLCIDNGNSRTKCAVYNAQGEMIATKIFDDDSFNDMYTWISGNNIIHAIISTTGKRIVDIARIIIPGKIIELTHEIPLPVQIIYSTPETLGRDRIAAACGAHALLPDKNCLVVDAGTCITTDLLLATGIYLGGNIAPGLFMRLKAMHEQTARLPLVDPEWPELAFGDSTVHALQNGAGLGMVMEIEGHLNLARKAYGDVSIVITGGDAAFLASKLESRIFVEPELVTQGLFQILSFNVQNTT